MCTKEYARILCPICGGHNKIQRRLVQCAPSTGRSFFCTGTHLFHSIKTDYTGTTICEQCAARIRRHNRAPSEAHVQPNATTPDTRFGAHRPNSSNTPTSTQRTSSTAGVVNGQSSLDRPRPAIVNLLDRPRRNAVSHPVPVPTSATAADLLTPQRVSTTTNANITFPYSLPDPDVAGVQHARHTGRTPQRAPVSAVRSARTTLNTLPVAVDARTELDIRDRAFARVLAGQEDALYLVTQQRQDHELAQSLSGSEKAGLTHTEQESIDRDIAETLQSMERMSLEVEDAQLALCLAASEDSHGVPSARNLTILSRTQHQHQGPELGGYRQFLSRDKAEQNARDLRRQLLLSDCEQAHSVLVRLEDEIPARAIASNFARGREYSELERCYRELQILDNADHRATIERDRRRNEYENGLM